MKRAAVTLADYAFATAVCTTDRDTWKRIATWQREGLVTVKPVAKDSATVVLTDKGREAVRKGQS